MARRLPVALVLSGVLLIAAACGSAPKTSKSVTLKLLDGRSEKATACDQTRPHPYQVYRVGTRLSMEGSVVPSPALPDGAWRVKIKFKECKLGHFVTVAQVHVKGSGGHFRYTRPLRAPGVFFARTYYYGYTPALISADAYFRVTP